MCILDVFFFETHPSSTIAMAFTSFSNHQCQHNPFNRLCYSEGRPSASGPRGGGGGAAATAVLCLGPGGDGVPAGRGPAAGRAVF